VAPARRAIAHGFGDVYWSWPGVALE